MAPALAAPGSRGRPQPTTSLDGLRGLAALVVVVHHSLLTWQVLAAQYFVPNHASGTWWLTFTPLHLAWAGTEAVMVFFVLSGLVLSLPFLHGPLTLPRWRGYYGSRVIRLYLPAVVALGVAPVWVMGWPRVPGASTSWWFDGHAVEVRAATLAEDALLLRGVSWINTSLWSLQYEVLFSLFLPLYVLVARRLGEPSGWLVPPLLVLAGAGVQLGSLTLAWLPVFGVGVAMVAARARLLQWGDRINGLRASGPVWAVVGATTVILLLAEWWSRPGPRDPGGTGGHPVPEGGRCRVDLLPGHGLPRGAEAVLLAAGGLAGVDLLLPVPGARTAPGVCLVTGRRLDLGGWSSRWRLPSCSARSWRWYSNAPSRRRVSGWRGWWAGVRRAHRPTRRGRMPRRPSTATRPVPRRPRARAAPRGRPEPYRSTHR